MLNTTDYLLSCEKDLAFSLGNEICTNYILCQACAHIATKFVDSELKPKEKVGIYYIELSLLGGCKTSLMK